MNRRTLPIFMAFLCMGFGDAVGPFVGLAKESFQLSNTTAQFIPFVGFVMFGLLSIPMGIFQDKMGKRTVLIMGLMLALIGLAIPMVFGITLYPVFLITILLLGAGATILQVAGNPIMRDVSEAGKYSRNLSLGQFVKAIGSLSGPVIPAVAAAWWHGDWKMIFPIYCAFLLLSLVLVAFMKYEPSAQTRRSATFASCFALMKNRQVAMMVVAIFLYVGAEVCMSSGVPLYLEAQFSIDIGTLGILGTGLFFLALTIGRFMGGLILNWMPPKNFFILTVAVSIFSLLGLFTGIQFVAVISVFTAGLGFANVFPLIFSMTIDSMPERSDELSGLMVTAIVGGAFIPPLMGMVADRTSVLIGFVVPLAAVLYILWAALVNLKISR